MAYGLILLAFVSVAFSSILGIDFGTSSYKMVLTPEGKRKQMQLMFNDQSSRKTENAIGFRGEERLFGSFAINNMKYSPATSYAYLRDLLGVRSVEVAKERVGRYVSYADHLFETEGDYKLIGIKNPVTGNNFTVLELVGMIFQQAVRNAEKDSGSKIHDLCVTVPVYFTDVERQALMDAASIAGLRIIALVDQGTALAVSYGNEQTFDSAVLRNVIFFDLGESSLQLTLAQFSSVTEGKKTKTQAQILASAYEMVGGRDFNEALVQHFMQQVKEKSGKPDIDQNPRVVSKVRIQMGKTKETLSASKDASFTLQYLDTDFDFSGSITRDEFEGLTADIYPRIEAALERLMSQTNVTKDEIYAVELIGGSSRVPRVHTIIRKFFNKEKMDNHMNSDEAAVFGSAFYGASNSGRYISAGVKITDLTKIRDPNATAQSNTSQVVLLPTTLKDEFRKSLIHQDHVEALRLKNNKIKNDIEAMIYDMKARIEDEVIVQVSNELQRTSLLLALEEANVWLEEEGPGANISVSREKLKSLEKLVNPILLRVSELKKLPASVEQCGKILEGSPGYLKVLNETKDISEREFLGVLADVANAQEWLERELEAHKKLLPHEETTFTSHAIDKRCGKIIKDLERLAKRGKRIPPKPPKPPKVEPTTPPADSSEPQPAAEEGTQPEQQQQQGEETQTEQKETQEQQQETPQTEEQSGEESSEQKEL